MPKIKSEYEDLDKYKYNDGAIYYIKKDTQLKLQSEYDDLDKCENEYGDILYCKKNTDIWHNPYGPAIIRKNGYKEYWIENKRHRLDGPAIIHSNGKEFYCINGKSFSKQEFETHPERLKFLGKEHLTCLK